VSKAVKRHFYQKELAVHREKREEEIRKRRIASTMAREISRFWTNVKRVVELRELGRIDELRKTAMDQQLSFIVDQTEKYSDLLAEKFKSVVKEDEEEEVKEEETTPAPTELEHQPDGRNSEEILTKYFSVLTK
jgi:E1A-binding protein p400